MISFVITKKIGSMAERLNPKELVSFEELIISISIQIEALTQLLVEKGVFTFVEIF
jgi:hypothetical protein